MSHLMKRVLLALAALVLLSVNAEAAGRLKIGVTLHPYYSFTANIVGDLAEVVPLIDAKSNPHSYEPRPEDIRRAMSLDAVVVNGIGHDEWAFGILRAAQVLDKIPVIYANDGVALIPVAGGGAEKTVNAHSFISITTSIQQIYTIARELGRVDPANAKAYRDNARAYTKRLRRLKAGYMKRLAALRGVEFRCATIHGAYGYLLQEFGLEVAAVVEPRHGVKPSASQFRDTIDAIRALDVDVVFSEMHFPSEYVQALRKATGVALYSFSHISHGEYSPELFEVEMRKNLENLTEALEYAASRHKEES